PPASTNVCAGSAANFSVSASGTVPLGYQWFKGASAIANETNSSFTIGSTSTGDAGSYSVVVSNLCGNVTSDAATLTVDTAPSIGNQPSSTNVCAGSSASFSVSASGTAPLTYQWFK